MDENYGQDTTGTTSRRSNRKRLQFIGTLAGVAAGGALVLWVAYLMLVGISNWWTSTPLYNNYICDQKVEVTRTDGTKVIYDDVEVSRDLNGNRIITIELGGNRSAHYYVSADRSEGPNIRIDYFGGNQIARAEGVTPPEVVEACGS